MSVLEPEEWKWWPFVSNGIMKGGVDETRRFLLSPYRAGKGGEEEEGGGEVQASTKRR